MPSYFTGLVPGQDSNSILTDVRDVYTSGGAVAALLLDGTVVAWGTAFHGDAANSIIVPANMQSVNAPDFQRVTSLMSTEYTFIATFGDGKNIQVFGSNEYSMVSGVPADLGAVEALYTNAYAAVAWTTDERVVTWGMDGNFYPMTGAPMQALATPAGLTGGTGFLQICGTTAFRALSAAAGVYACLAGSYGLTSRQCEKCPAATPHSKVAAR